ncbi:hypothetical protein I7I48_07359 [Histoplasma ohiense]|nr:hypothetical protein I7I48_07359 [Histoplasma ohiense (nom. inval.)]
MKRNLLVPFSFSLFLSIHSGFQPLFCTPELRIRNSNIYSFSSYFSFFFLFFLFFFFIIFFSGCLNPEIIKVLRKCRGSPRFPR